MNVNLQRRLAVSAAIGGLLAIGVMTPASAIAASPTAVSTPSAHVITYNVLNAQGQVIESTVGHRGPLAAQLSTASVSAASAQPLITQQSSCPGSYTAKLYLYRQGAHPYCFTGTGIANVSITNVTEIVTDSDDVSIEWHSPSSSGNAHFGQYTTTYTNTVHWTADSEDVY